MKEAKIEKNTGLFQDAFLYTAVALKQKIDPEESTLKLGSVSVLLERSQVTSAFVQSWISPAIYALERGINCFYPAAN